jgi:hypothetical protein
MLDRYTPENFRKLLGNPGYLGWEAQRILFDLIYSNDAVDVMNEDWDNLILLDACRYDYFESQNKIQGNLSSIISHGGSSWEFMQGNFVGNEHHDTVYVTGNPHTGKLADDIFHAVDPLYLNAWDEEYETVLPEDVVDAALDAYEKFPNKRLVVHFMQPHRPYLGETGEELQQEHKISGFNRYLAYSDETPDSASFSTLIENGDISVKIAQKAYRETLDIVLQQVDDLVTQLAGKSIISADHGELLGETIIPFTKPKFGHSDEYIRNKTLYQVPWLELPANERREISSDKPLTFDRAESEIVEDRLRSLGYK